MKLKLKKKQRVKAKEKEYFNAQLYRHHSFLVLLKKGSCPIERPSYYHTDNMMPS